MSTPGGRPIIKTFTCRCGWERHWNADARGERMIDHPLYGLVRSRDAAVLDIRNHNCAAAALASRKAASLFGVRKTGYSPLLPEVAGWS